MSMPHHEHSEITRQELEAKSRMLDEFLGKATPQFPRGKINDRDMGELSFAVALDVSKQAVIIRFAKHVDWVGLDRKTALHLAGLLTEKANQLPES